MTTSSQLGNYLLAFTRHWKLILGILVFSGLGGIFLTWTMPPLYGTTARVAIIATNTALPPMAQLAIFQSDEVATQTLRDLQHSGLGQNETPITLARNVRVSNDLQDRTVFRVVAQARTPQQAVTLANLWARNGAQEVNRQYYTMRRANQTQKLQLALERLNIVESAFERFLQTNNLTRQQVSGLLTSDLPDLLRQDRQVLSTQSVLLGLTPDQTLELARILWEYQIALLTYTDLAKEMAQLDITSQIATDSIFIVNAEVPREPLQPQPLVNFAIAFAVSLTSGILISLSAEYLTRAHQTISADKID